MCRRVLFLLIIFVIVLAELVAANDSYIKNPADCYKKTRQMAMQGDSLYVGSIFFETLPEYRQPGIVKLTFVAHFDCDNGAFIQLRNQTAAVKIIPERFYWHQAIKAGDTLHAAVTFIPQVVGFYRLDFQIYENNPFDYFGKQYEALPRQQLTALLVLGIDGKTLALNTDFACPYYATFLGPNAELLKDSIIFLEDPKEENELTRVLESKTYQLTFFAIRAVVYLTPDEEGYRKIVYHVSPYHDYPSKIEMKIYDDGDILYKDIITCDKELVRESDTVLFSLKFNAPLEQPKRISARFSASNPDSGRKDGIFWGKPEIISNLNIYFYEMNTGEMKFMTDISPTTFLKPKSMYSSPSTDFYKNYEIQKSRDPRVEWLKGIISTKYNW